MQCILELWFKRHSLSSTMVPINLLLVIYRNYTTSSILPLVHKSLNDSNWRALWKNRTSWYISFFSAHHSMVFYFRCSVYWWKGSQILVF